MCFIKIVKQVLDQNTIFKQFTINYTLVIKI